MPLPGCCSLKPQCSNCAHGLKTGFSFTFTYIGKTFTNLEVVFSWVINMIVCIQCHVLIICIVLYCSFFGNYFLVIWWSLRIKSTFFDRWKFTLKLFLKNTIWIIFVKIKLNWLNSSLSFLIWISHYLWRGNGKKLNIISHKQPY